MTAPRRIGSIEVGFRLIRVLEAADGPLSLKELSERGGMAASKAYAYVASFVHEGFLAQDPASGHYGLGPFALSIGVAALRQSDLIEYVRSASEALSDATTASVMLAMWGNRGPTIVYRHDGKRRGPTTIRVGYVLPVWRSSAGRIFVAYLPEHDTATLLEIEEGAAVPGPAMAAEIAQIRAAGFALGSEGSTFSGIAAPILDHDGHLAAALTLSRPSERNTGAHRLEIGRLLSECASDISRRIGYAPAATPRPAVKGKARAPEKKFPANDIYS